MGGENKIKIIKKASKHLGKMFKNSYERIAQEKLSHNQKEVNKNDKKNKEKGKEV